MKSPLMKLCQVCEGLAPGYVSSFTASLNNALNRVPEEGILIKKSFLKQHELIWL